MKNKRVLKSLIACLLAIGLLAGCDIINPEEPIPGYIHIPEVSVQSIEEQGSASAKITEAWVTVDGEFIGAFPIPSDIPILKQGEVEVFVQAGIKDNGIGSTPEIYPFYEAYQQVVTLGENTTDTLRPVFRYLDATTFALVEGFESGSQVFRDVFAGNISQFDVVESGAFEGEGALRIQLDSLSPLVQVATFERFPQIVDNNSSLVYLEMNYRSEVPVVFGLIGYESGQLAGGQTEYIAGFLPSAEWNKIYFNFSLEAIQLGRDEYQVFLQASIPDGADGAPTTDQATIWLDNVKLLHF